jgi:hypothetical protein
LSMLKSSDVNENVLVFVDECAAAPK